MTWVSIPPIWTTPLAASFRRLKSDSVRSVSSTISFARLCRNSPSSVRVIFRLPRSKSLQPSSSSSKLPGEIWLRGMNGFCRPCNALLLHNSKKVFKYTNIHNKAPPFLTSDYIDEKHKCKAYHRRYMKGRTRYTVWILLHGS